MSPFSALNLAQHHLIQEILMVRPECSAPTPCFSWVSVSSDDRNRFNGFAHGVKTVETIPRVCSLLNTELKQGVNDSLAARRQRIVKSAYSGILRRERASINQRALRLLGVLGLSDGTVRQAEVFRAQLHRLTVFGMAINESQIRPLAVQGGVELFAGRSTVMPERVVPRAADPEIRSHGGPERGEAHQPQALLHKNYFRGIADDRRRKFHDHCIGQIAGGTEFGRADRRNVRLRSRRAGVHLRTFPGFALQVTRYDVQAIVPPASGLRIHEVEHLRSFRRQLLKIAFVHHQGETDLPLVAQATRLAALLLGASQGRQKHRSEHGDDGNDHEKLDKRKREERWARAVSHS